MATYAQTNFEVECQNAEQAKNIAGLLKKHTKEEKRYDGEGVFHVNEVESANAMVYGFMSSVRYQNLEYQCELVWNFIRKLGAKSANFPFLIQGDGQYYDA